MEEDEVRNMLRMKNIGNTKEVERIMAGVDTVVYKYSLGKNSFDHDADLIIYRAAGIHLYVAEIYSRWLFSQDGIVRTDINLGLNILNDGSYNGDKQQLGVRGRVGFGTGDDAVKIDNILYHHDPYTNEIIGQHNIWPGNLSAKQDYL